MVKSSSNLKENEQWFLIFCAGSREDTIVSEERDLTGRGGKYTFTIFINEITNVA